jgi:hypothetical protein
MEIHKVCGIAQDLFPKLSFSYHESYDHNSQYFHWTEIEWLCEESYDLRGAMKTGK